MDLSPNARITYEKRYLMKDEKGDPTETPEDLLHRVAGNIAAIEKNYGKDNAEVKRIAKRFYDIMAEAQFMPNSPTLMNAGRELQQLSACFVLPLEDSMEGIFTALKNMALVQKTGGGTGFAFDRLRPASDPVRSTNGIASGPLSFLKIFDAATEAVKQGGTRRGANMGSLIYNHPDILEFIGCKGKEDEINNFNLSVTVSDEFMSKATGEDPDPTYVLINPRTNQPHLDPETGNEARLDAMAVFDLIVQNAWGKGDPGIIFIDKMNHFNPTPHVGKYETTNPCVPGDTFVLTADGPRQVKSLVGRKTTLIVNGNYFQSTAKGFFSTGIKPLYRIKTEQGYTLRATGDHPVLRIKRNSTFSLEKEWAPLETLKPGDQIMLHDHRELKGWKGLYNEEEGYLLGALFENGTVNCDSTCCYNLAQPGATTTVSTALKNTDHLPQPVYYRGRRAIDKIKNTKIDSAALKEIVLSLGMTKDEKTITPYFETATSSQFIKGFLKGLFDTHGSVHNSYEKGFFIKLANNDEENLQAVQRMLARFGIASTIYEKRIKEITKNLSKSNDACNISRTKIQPELIISHDNAAVFAETINFSDPEKQISLEHNRAPFKRRFSQDDFKVTVKSRTPAGNEEVYDIQVPGINAFDANGIVVHNCGEQPLLPYEACCLGSINLGKFVTEKGKINWTKLAGVVKTAVRFLDNVVDASNYVISEIAKMHKDGNRKIGLGIMGWHDMLIRLGICYDSEEAIETANKIMDFINKEAKKESIHLAEERGVFPNFESSIYDTGKKDDQVRNATRTTIAPTGTISILAGCSSGIEPYFSIAYIRKNILGGVDLPEVNPLFLEIAKEEGFHSEELIHEIARSGSIPKTSAVPDKYKTLFKTAMEFDYSWHVQHQAAFQSHTDNAVSKTINLKQDATIDDVKNAYITAWKAGCKGITIYRDSSRSKQVLNVGDGEKDVTLKPTKRPKTLSGQTTSISTALGNLFVTVNSADGKPFELFAQIGKAGSDVIAFTEAIARLISLALRCGVSVDEIVTQLEGIGGARSVGYGPNRIMSVPDAIGQALRKLAHSEITDNNPGNSHARELCPDCGTCALIRAEGCLKCEACGFSEC